MKAQIGVEHIALVSIVLLIVVVGLFHFGNAQADNAGMALKALVNAEGDHLIETINNAPILGTGSRQTVTLHLPDEFLSARLSSSSKTIIINLSSSQGTEQMVFVSNFPLIDNDVLSNLKPGKKKLYIISREDGVCISEIPYCGDECGNGIATGTEVCDINDFQGSTCTTINSSYTGGVLICNSDCSEIGEDYCET